MFHVINLESGSTINPYSTNYLPKDNKNGVNFGGFTTDDEARKFAEACAMKWDGTEFGVVKVIAKVKTSKPPLAWTTVQ